MQIGQYDSNICQVHVRLADQASFRTILCPESTVLFVGYQAGNSGAKNTDGDKLVNIHGEKIAVNAEIVNIESYSAHADQQGLLIG